MRKFQKGDRVVYTRHMVGKIENIGGRVERETPTGRYRVRLADGDGVTVASTSIRVATAAEINLAEQPSDRMLAMLRGIAAGRGAFSHLQGRSQHGGAQNTLHALKGRGWITDTVRCELTEAGREVLKRCAA